MDDPLLSVLGLLYGDDRPERSSIRVVPQRKRQGNTVPRSWVSSEDDNIYVDEDLDIYKKAMKGDVDAQRNLAGILGHEQFHKKVTNQEGPSYQKQLEILQSLKAPSSEIARVKASQRAVAPNYRVLKSKPINFGLFK